MVAVNWAAVYAERDHDATIERIIRRIGSRADDPVCQEKKVAVDALVARLSADSGATARGTAGKSGTYDITTSLQALDALTVHQQQPQPLQPQQPQQLQPPSPPPEKRLNELLGEFCSTCFAPLVSC